MTLDDAKQALLEKRHDDTMAICRELLTTDPRNPETLVTLGIASMLTGDPVRGAELIEEALAIQPHPLWYAHLQSAYRTCCQIDKAMEAGENALRLHDGSPDIWANHALTLADADRFDDCKVMLAKAIGLKHDHAEAHLGLAQILLAQGDYQRGLAEYEWRQHVPGAVTWPQLTSMPWNGMSLPGARLLLIADQGYGDSIQFARYIAMARERVTEVVVGCSREMAPLFARMDGVTSTHSTWNEIPLHAFHATLSSLPYLFETRVNTIPARRPYIQADPEKVAQWAWNTNYPKVGFVWRGRPKHPNDKRRSLSLAQMRPLIERAGGHAVSLQFEMTEDEAELFSDFSGQMTDFSETAALIANLDLVISVDTAVAHLAGAMGKEVWILLPKVADWRWLLDRSDSPWYPSAWLFRQSVCGDWSPVLRRVGATLDEWISERTPHSSSAIGHG